MEADLFGHALLPVVGLGSGFTLPAGRSVEPRDVTLHCWYKDREQKVERTAAQRASIGPAADRSRGKATR